jgi:Na+/proline symporter
MWSVTLTEALQIIIALSGLVILAVATFWQFGDGSLFAGIDRLLLESDPGTLTLIPPLATASLLAYFGAWATGVMGNIPGQDLQQRVFSARDERTAVQACLLTGVTYFCFGMIPVSLGLVSRIIVPDAPENGILWVMVNLFLSPTFAVFFILVFTSMVISTTTSAILAPATIISYSLVSRRFVFQNRKLLLERASVLLVSLGGIALTFLDRSKMELLDLSMSLTLVSLFIPFWAGLYGRPRSAWSAMLAMTLGLSCFMIRWLPENVLLPMPQGVIVVTSQGTRMVEYHNYVAYERIDGFTFPRMNQPDAAELNPTDVPRLSARAGIVRDLLVVPAPWYGLIASLIGYLLGQAIYFRRTPINAQTLQDAWGERWTRFT